MAITAVRGNRRTEQMFFTVMAALILVTVAIGFSRSYFLAGVFLAPLPNLLVHVHGAVFSAWVLLFVAQTWLVRAGRVDIHRRLGLLGFGLASLVVIMGLVASTDALGRHYTAADSGAAARTFYAIPIADMIVFATLIYFAYRERLHAAAHKRLIVIANIALLDAAFVRWPVSVSWWGIEAAQYCCIPLLMMLVGYDLWSTGKLQRVTIWGSLFVVAFQQLRFLVAPTTPWQDFAGWVQNMVR